MADKTVTYQNKIISATVVDDFYARLNALRAQGGVEALIIPNVKNDVAFATQVSNIYSAILNTKNAVSFLKNVNLTVSFAGVAGDIITAPNSVSILEYNIGELENACKNHFSANKEGYSGDANYSTNNVPVFTTNTTVATKSANFVPNCGAHFLPNWGSNGSWFFAGHNSSDSSRSSWKPHCSGLCHFTNSNFSRWCGSGVNGCFAVKKRNSNFFSNVGNCSGFFSGNFSGFCTDFSAFFTGHCTAVKTANNGTVYTSNMTANNVGVSASNTVVWGVYQVEGIHDF